MKTPIKKKLTFELVERSRREFGKNLKQFTKEGGRYLDYAPSLSEKHVKNCKILESRYKILEQLPKNAVCAEIGVDKAEFSKEILRITSPKKLVLFDIDISRIEINNIFQSVQKSQTEIIEGDSATNLSKFPDEHFDWIYIDGDHKYEGVKNDIAAAAKKVKKNGYLCFNDYTVWSPASMFHCGVARAVNEFCIEENWELMYFSFQTLMYNDCVIRKIGN